MPEDRCWILEVKSKDIPMTLKSVIIIRITSAGVHEPSPILLGEEMETGMVEKETAK